MQLTERSVAIKKQEDAFSDLHRQQSLLEMSIKKLTEACGTLSNEAQQKTHELEQIESRLKVLRNKSHLVISEVNQMEKRSKSLDDIIFKEQNKTSEAQAELLEKRDALHKLQLRYIDHVQQLGVVVQSVRHGTISPLSIPDQVFSVSTTKQSGIENDRVMSDKFGDTKNNSFQDITLTSELSSLLSCLSDLSEKELEKVSHDLSMQINEEQEKITELRNNNVIEIRKRGRDVNDEKEHQKENIRTDDNCHNSHASLSSFSHCDFSTALQYVSLLIKVLIEITTTELSSTSNKRVRETLFTRLAEIEPMNSLDDLEYIQKVSSFSASGSARLEGIQYALQTALGPLFDAVIFKKSGDGHSPRLITQRRDFTRERKSTPQTEAELHEICQNMDATGSQCSNSISDTCEEAGQTAIAMVEESLQELSSLLSSKKLKMTKKEDN